jgi:hypothetical protein
VKVVAVIVGEPQLLRCTAVVIAVAIRETWWWRRCASERAHGRDEHACGPAEGHVCRDIIKTFVTAVVVTVVSAVDQVR